MEYMLSVQRLKKYYAAHKAVDDISFDIGRGTIFGLLGPNGAGKTTLLRMITGIFFPDEGQVLLGDRPFDPLEDTRLIGYMPEERGLYKKMALGEQLVYLARLKGVSQHDAVAKARSWAQRFDLASWWSRKVGDLSKGMQQKAQFISTILHEPELLILDEPFSGLDPINANLIKEQIFELASRGTTVIFSTHRMEQVEEICRHIILVNRGKKILDGALDRVKQDFKKNLYRLTLAAPFSGAAVGDAAAFSVVRQDAETLELKLGEGASPNEVLRWFMEQGHTITGFREVLPSINEVFIELVTGTPGTARS